MNSLADLKVRELRTSDLDTYKTLRDHALSQHAEAFTPDAVGSSTSTTCC
jgi:hypothetical protein